MADGKAIRLIAMPGAMLSMKEGDLMDGGSGRMIDLPCPCYLIEHPKGLVLFDTGCNPQGGGRPGRLLG